MSDIQTNTKKVVTKILNNLPKRNRDIISRRFGLKNGDKETLEAIGQNYGITRERVRQIEDSSLGQLKEKLFDYPEVGPYLSLAYSILDEHGGVMKEEDLFDHFSGSAKRNATNASLVLLMNLDNKFRRSAETDNLHTFWTLSDAHVEQAHGTLATLTAAFKKHNQPVVNDNLYELYKKHTDKPISPKALLAYTSLSKNINKNIFGEVGLAHWPEINPRGVRDKAYLVLRKSENPLHFREITELINDSGFNKKKANIQTVHNELIKDSRFVLVGRGIYALSQWGYKSGTVKDVLEQVLKESGKPLSRADLTAKVLSTRFVKENTILLNLQDDKFKRLEDGNYVLEEV